MAILDSDILVALLRNDREAMQKIQNFEALNLGLSTTSINGFELFNGAYLSSEPDKNMEAVFNLLENMEMFVFGLKEAETAGKISAGLKKNGKMIGSFDQLIAAITIANNEVLVTRNIEHFKNIPGLRIERW